MKKLFFLLAFSFVFCSTFSSAITLLDDAITWAYTKKLTIYLNPSDFKPDNNIRRDEAAKFFVNFAKLVGKTSYTVNASQCQFSDLNQAWDDLREIIVESCRLGIFKGSNGKFNPTGNLSNAEAIAVLVRIVDGYQTENGLAHWADNYYKRANELKLLGDVNMNSKDSSASRGNMITLLYGAREMKGTSATQTSNTDDVILNENKIAFSNNCSNFWCYPSWTYNNVISYKNGHLGFVLNQGQDGANIRFTYTEKWLTYSVDVSVAPLVYNNYSDSGFLQGTHILYAQNNNPWELKEIKKIQLNDCKLQSQAFPTEWDDYNRYCYGDVIEHILKLMNGTEKDTNFTQKFNEFTQAIDNKTLKQNEILISGNVIFFYQSQRGNIISKDIYLPKSNTARNTLFLMGTLTTPIETTISSCGWRSIIWPIQSTKISLSSIPIQEECITVKVDFTTPCQIPEGCRWLLCLRDEYEGHVCYQ